jgi:hypothetical protein
MSKTGNNFGKRNGQNIMLGSLERTPIHEDDDEQHVEVEDFRRRRGNRGVIPGSKIAGNMSDIEEAARQQK